VKGETVHHRAVSQENFSLGLVLVDVRLNRLCPLPAKAREVFPVSPGQDGIGLDDILPRPWRKRA